MFLHLIATFMTGVLAVSIVFVIGRLSKGRMPRYMMPIAAGLAMLAYNIWSEYTWHARTADALPGRMALVEVPPPSASPFAPWTYIVRRADSIKVIDKESVHANPKKPGFVIAQVYEIIRRGQTLKESKIIDCAGRRYANLSATTTFDDDGFPTNVSWQPVGAGSKLVTLACAVQPSTAKPAAAAPNTAPTSGDGPATAAGQ